jgi:hypothetical protein
MRGGYLGAVFNPTDKGTLFQDTGGTTPVTAHGQSVARKNDISGNGNHATQATAAKRPLYIENGNNRYIEFDGVDDEMFSLTFSSPCTQLCATRSLSATSANKRMFELGSPSSNGYLDGGGLIGYWSVFGSGEPPGITAAAVPSRSRHSVVGTVWESATVRTPWINGVKLAAFNPRVNAANTAYGSGTGGNFCQVAIGASLIINRALTDAETLDACRWIAKQGAFNL